MSSATNVARGGGAGAPADVAMSRQAKSHGHRPVRTCIGCRRVAPVGELVRVARRPDGSLAVGRRQPGRGAWLCAATTASCFETAVTRRAFTRALRGEVTGDQLDVVRGKLLV